MLELLSHYHHLPSRAEDRLVTLFLPKLDVKFPIWKPVSNNSSLPILLIVAHTFFTLLR
jgi:hypothetical protein